MAVLSPITTSRAKEDTDFLDYMWQKTSLRDPAGRVDMRLQFVDGAVFQRLLDSDRS
jgi:hypothetical protein